MTTPIIGIWSPTPSAGKSAVAKYMQQANPIYRIIGLLDPATAMANALMQQVEMPWQQYYESLHIDKDKPVTQLPGGMSTRRLRMQLMQGLEVGQPEFTARWMERRIRESGQPAIVDDLSSLANVRAVRALGGRIVSVTRPGLDLIPPGFDSDCDLQAVNPEVEIVNDGALYDLELRAAMALAALETEV